VTYEKLKKTHRSFFTHVLTGIIFVTFFQTLRFKEKSPGEVPSLLRMLSKMVLSVLKHSLGSPLHLIFITDSDSRLEVGNPGWR
jgi:hypothetical protein